MRSLTLNLGRRRTLGQRVSAYRPAAMREASCIETARRRLPSVFSRSHVALSPAKGDQSPQTSRMLFVCDEAGVHTFDLVGNLIPGKIGFSFSSTMLSHFPAFLGVRKQFKQRSSGFPGVSESD